MNNAFKTISTLTTIKLTCRCRNVVIVQEIMEKKVKIYCACLCEGATQHLEASSQTQTKLPPFILCETAVRSGFSHVHPHKGIYTSGTTSPVWRDFIGERDQPLFGLRCKDSTISCIYISPGGVGQGHVCPQNGRRGCSLLCILPILAKSRHISRNTSHRLFLCF